MLNIYFGKMEEAVYDTSTFFKHAYKDKWITDETVKEIIKDVDNSEVESANLIQSPVLGPISPYQLSGGVKTLILIDKDHKHIFNASKCGDNCAKWILKFAENKKVVINLRHIMNFGNKEFKIKIINNGKIVNNMAELVLAAGDYV